MSYKAITHGKKLRDHIPFLQVKAFLRLIFEIGGVLEQHRQYSIGNSTSMPGRIARVEDESTGANGKLVTSVTDCTQTNGLFSRERKRDPSGVQEGLGQNQRGERLHDEEQTGARTAHDGALAEIEETSAERKQSRKAYCNP